VRRSPAPRSSRPGSGRSRAASAPVSGKARPRIVVVGANFAGLSAAQRLGPVHDVTVIDGSPWFEWRPGIHELLSGMSRAADLRLPRARLVSRAGHRFLRAAVTHIDARAGRLTTSDDRQVEFDACIVAVGGVVNTFGVEGADRHAMPLKTVDDGAAIGRRLAALVRRKGRQSVVIVGAGLEGIEALGEILRKYRGRESLHIRVIETGSRLMPGSPRALDRAVRAHCEDLGVEFLVRTAAAKVTRSRVHLGSGGSLRSDLTIWTAGATAPELVREAGLSDRKQPWAPVRRTLLSRRFDNVFVAGDAAVLRPGLAKQAYNAMQMGQFAAENAVRALAGRRLREFIPVPKPMLVAFGDLDTFLVSGRSVIASPTLAAAKEAVFQLSMAQIDPPLRPAPLRALTDRVARTAAKLYLSQGRGRAGRG
jgi:NADH dehydrogenase FAD-containing subunit